MITVVIATFSGIQCKDTLLKHKENERHTELNTFQVDTLDNNKINPIIYFKNKNHQ